MGLRRSSPHSSKQKDYWDTISKIFDADAKDLLFSISSLYFFVPTSGFHQSLCYNQAITMIYRGYVLNKMADVYIRILSRWDRKKRVYCFVAGELLLCIFYSDWTSILWVMAVWNQACKYEKFSCGFNIFYSRSGFVDYAGLRVNWLTDLLMPSDKHNSIMAKVTG